MHIFFQKSWARINGLGLDLRAFLKGHPFLLLIIHKLKIRPGRIFTRPQSFPSSPAIPPARITAISVLPSRISQPQLLQPCPASPGCSTAFGRSSVVQAWLDSNYKTRPYFLATFELSKLTRTKPGHLLVSNHTSNKTWLHSNKA